MSMGNQSPEALSRQLGERLKQARLNRNLTQAKVAAMAGVSRNVVVAAEKGRTRLESFVAILMALDLADSLNRFLPPQELSPLQLAKLRGKARQRASGRRGKETEDVPEW